MIALAVTALTVALSPRGADPGLAAVSDRLVAVRADLAEEQIVALEDAVTIALDEARRAGAAVVAGDEAPSTHVHAAAELTAEAENGVQAARSAVANLAAASDARRPGRPLPAYPTAVGELESIAAQMRASADAADAFAAMRQIATGIPTILDQALAALADGDVDRGSALVARARSDHATIAAWDVDLVTLPVWLETTDAMISAVQHIVDAVRQGDAAAAELAAEEFAALGADAARADRALRIAMGEGGSSVLAPPLERLASVLADIRDARIAAAAE